MAESGRVLARQVSPELPMELKLEQEISQHGSNQAATNRTQKLIEQKEKELRESILANYQRIKGVEAELGQLTLQLQVNVGPRKHALELLRYKIERQNEKVCRVRAKYDAAKKVLDVLEAELAREEAAKEQLCAELGLLVQESATAQLAKLEELKNHLESLNRGVQASAGSPVASPQSDQPGVQADAPVLALAGGKVAPTTDADQGAGNASAPGRTQNGSGIQGRGSSADKHLQPVSAVRNHAVAAGGTAVQGAGSAACLIHCQDDRDHRLLEEVKAARVRAANGSSSRSNSPANSTAGAGPLAAARRAPSGASLYVPEQQPRMQAQVSARTNGHAQNFNGFDV